MPDKSKKTVADILAAARKADTQGGAPAKSDGEDAPAETAKPVALRITAGGAVITSAPSFAASWTWIGLLTLATRIWVAKS